MPYGNTWNSDAQRYADMEWAGVREITQVLRGMLRNGFNTQAARSDNLKLWNGLDMSTPVAHDIHFTPHKSFVCLDRGDWPIKIGQLTAALNYKGTAASDDAMAPPGTETSSAIRARALAPPTTPNPAGAAAPADVRGYAKYDDALNAFTWAINNMRSEIGSGDYVYTRETFEAKFGLTWA